MMKRIVALLLAAMLCLLTLAAGAEEKYSLTPERIQAMTQHMAELATGDYLLIKGVPEDLRQTALEWASGIEGKPRMIVRADVENSAAMLNVRAHFLTEPEIVSMEMESSALFELVWILAYYACEEAKVTGVTYERFNEVNGLINASMRYAQPGANGGYGLYFVLYEDATPIVLVANYENGTAAVVGWFLPSSRLGKCTNAGQVAMWLMLNGFPMTCEEVVLP